MKLHTFNDREGLRIAVEIERKGRQFYRAVQALVDNPKAEEILSKLEADEQRHMNKFQSLYDQQLERGEQEETQFDMETNAYLSAIASEVVFPGGAMSSLLDDKLETMQDVVADAIQAEKDSILFYLELANKTRDASLQEIFLAIVQEEKEHLFGLQALYEEGDEIPLRGKRA